MDANLACENSDEGSRFGLDWHELGDRPTMFSNNETLWS